MIRLISARLATEAERKLYRFELFSAMYNVLHCAII